MFPKISYDDVVVQVFFNCGGCQGKPVDDSCDSCRVALKYALDAMNSKVSSVVMFPTCFYEAKASIGPVPLFAVLCFYHGVINRLLELFSEDEEANEFFKPLHEEFRKRRYSLSDRLEILVLYEQTMMIGLSYLDVANRVKGDSEITREMVEKEFQKAYKGYLTLSVVEYKERRCGNDKFETRVAMNDNWNAAQADYLNQDLEKE